MGVFNKPEKPLHSLLFRYILFYAFLTAIEADAAAACSDIAEIGIGHLARTVYYAAHDSDLDPFQMSGGSFYTRNGLLQIIECPTATGGRIYTPAC